MGHVREFGVLVACEKAIQNVHELVHVHRRSVDITIRAHNAINVHKKAKDFQRNESRERQSDLLLVSFSR